MATFSKGARVSVTGGPSAGRSGVVFWAGPSKYGPGMRYGVKADDGETIWASGDELEGEGGGAGAEAPAGDGAPPAVDVGALEAKVLRAVRRKLENGDETAAVALVDTLPAERRAAFYWKHVGPAKLDASYDLLRNTAACMAEVPLEVVIKALEARNKASAVCWTPGVGDKLVALLVGADLSDTGPLFVHRAALPAWLRVALAIARGQREIEGAVLGEAEREALADALPAHALSGGMGQRELGSVIDALDIPLERVQAPTEALLREGDGPVAFTTLGCVLFGLTAEALVALAPRLDLAGLTDRYLTWWLGRRAEALPEETLAQTTAVFAALGARLDTQGLDKEQLRWPGHALQAGARVLVERHLAAGAPVPEALLTRFSPHTDNLEPWMPLLCALPQDQRRGVLARLSGLVSDHVRPQLVPLEVAVGGEEALARLVADVEAGIVKANSVGVQHVFLPLGRLGAPVIPVLEARIAELTAALDPSAYPWSDGYRPRRVVIALRNALAVALGVAAPQRPLTEADEAVLLPAPATLFAGNDDFAYCFFDGLRAAGDLFSALPEARVRAFIEAWRDSGLCSHLEQRLKGALPKDRVRLLKDAPSLAQQVATLAAKTGLPCTRPLYLLSRGAKGAARGLNVVGGRPVGLESGRLPRGWTPVFVLDLATMPELGERYPGARALFVAVDDGEDGFDGGVVLPMSEAECVAGVKGGKPFVVERVEVPPEVFAGGTQGDLDTLRRRIAEAPARALGRPFFIQQDAYEGDDVGFILQSGESFSGLNLGDSGRMFVYEGDAFWECF